MRGRWRPRRRRRVGEGHPGAPAALAARYHGDEYMQELPESAQEMVGSVYAMLMNGGEKESSNDMPQKAAAMTENAG